MDGKLKCFNYIRVATPFILAGGKPTVASQEDWDFVIDALTAMLEKRFVVVWENKTHEPTLHRMVVLHTGEEKAKQKANTFMQDICTERGWDFTGFVMKSIELEDFECDDPRFGLT